MDSGLCVFDFFASSEPLSAFLAAAALVIGGSTFRVDVVFLGALPLLRCIIGMGAGGDHIDLDTCTHRRISVANAGRIYSIHVADHAVGMLIEVLHR
jgi:glyoxylate/hydroxypyruvate reductase